MKKYIYIHKYQYIMKLNYQTDSINVKHLSFSAFNYISRSTKSIYHTIRVLKHYITHSFVMLCFRIICFSHVIDCVLCVMVCVSLAERAHVLFHQQGVRRPQARTHTQAETTHACIFAQINKHTCTWAKKVKVAHLQ